MADTTYVIPYEPTAKQNEFHGCPADEVLYGGAVGGGKSLALLMEAFSRMLEVPHYRGAMFRRTFPELENSLIAMSRQVFPSGFGVYNETKHTWTFDFGNGDIRMIQFLYCKREEDVYNYQSAQWDDLFFDELTHFTEFQYTYLLSRLRAGRPGVFPRAHCATNPGGVGHGWVKRRWRIQDPECPPSVVWSAPAPAVTPDNPNPRALTRCFIPARVFDNPHVIQNDPAYLARLNELNESVRKALRDGDWTLVAGQAFPEFDPRIHVMRPFQIPASWKRFRGSDYGFTKPCAHLWVAQDPEGHLYLYREFYKAGVRDEEQANQVVKLSEGEKIEYTVVGHDVFGPRGGTGKSIAEVWQGKGMKPLVQGSLDRRSRKARLHNVLSLAPDGLPWLRIFSNCVNTIRTIPELVTDSINLEDVDTDGEDHAYDALTIVLTSRPEVFKTEAAPKPKQNHLTPESEREWANVLKRWDRLQQQEGGLEALNAY